MKKKICAVCGENAIDDSTCRKWFRQFCENNFNLIVSDTPRFGRPAEIDDGILALIESDRLEKFLESTSQQSNQGDYVNLEWLAGLMYSCVISKWRKV